MLSIAYVLGNLSDENHFFLFIGFGRVIISEQDSCIALKVDALMSPIILEAAEGLSPHLTKHQHCS